MTPHEACSGSKPNVKHLRVFGCMAYSHIPKDERLKLDSKTNQCILLGYGSSTISRENEHSTFETLYLTR